MKSARLSKPLKSLFFSITAIFCFAYPAQAQDGYAPPPMFDDMTPPMVRPQTNSGNIVEPKASPNTVLPPDASNAKPVIIPRVSVDPDAPQPPVTSTTTAPLPKQPVVAPAGPVAPKKMQPIIDPRDAKKVVTPKVPETKVPGIKKPEIKKPSAPAPAPPQKPAVKTEAKIEAPAKPEVTPVVPVKRDPKESAIKGPKTMPALPTESVDSQKTFEDKKGAVETETMLERHQHAVAAEKKAEEIKPIVPAPKSHVTPAAFDKSGQEALKKTIPFQQGQIGLSSAEIDPIAVTVNKELDDEDKKDWRVQIKAFATPYGTGVSSDRRIALSRALSLRSALIAQGIPAARIDVLAEGQSPETSGPADRIDLYLYGPSQD